MIMKIKQPEQKRTDVIIPIDTIDDIYSDFDLRSLVIRSLSIDFINEVKTQSKYSEEGSTIDIKILAPKKIRKTELPAKIETLTKKRVQEYFEDEYYSLRYERRKGIIKSFSFIMSGLFCFFLFKIISQYKSDNIIINTFYELITFFSWFATWYGIESIEHIKSRKELNLIKRIYEANLKFKFIKSFEEAEADQLSGIIIR